jgi:hypothetical protein
MILFGCVPWVWANVGFGANMSFKCLCEMAFTGTWRDNPNGKILNTVWTYEWLSKYLTTKKKTSFLSAHVFIQLSSSLGRRLAVTELAPNHRTKCTIYTVAMSNNQRLPWISPFSLVQSLSNHHKIPWILWNHDKKSYEITMKSL